MKIVMHSDDAFVGDNEPTITLPKPPIAACLSCGSDELTVRGSYLTGTLLLCIECGDERMHPVLISHQHTPTAIKAGIAI